jgi:hypothetical protein
VKEVSRILKKHGTFITQQVGGLNNKEINEFLGAADSRFNDWNLEAAVRN